MRTALKCARLGLGLVEPNPMVGAVIVRDGQELARGWHGRFGGPHAEIEALRAAEAAGADVRGATMYVTLEPCGHHGKTPPCTRALIEAGIARVVAGMQDPDEHVAGGGLDALGEAGIDVTVGLCQAEARQLLAAYIKLRTVRRPWVICKWAQTADGYLVPPGGRRWVTGAASRGYVHEVRGRCSGILIGVETLLADDPLLTNRSRPAEQAACRQPARIVLDTKLRTGLDCRLVQTAAAGPVILATTERAAARRAGRVRKLNAAGVEVLEVPGARRGVNLEALLDNLGQRNWTYLLVEGGAKVLRSFVYGGLADELLAFVNPEMSGGSPEGRAAFSLAEVRRRLRFDVGQVTEFGTDRMHRILLDPAWGACGRF